MRFAFCAFALAGLTACASTAPTSNPEPPLAVVRSDASIPFAAFGAIKGWERRQDGSLILEGSNGRLYRATFVGPCNQLNFAGPGIALQTGPLDSADRFSSIIVNGQTCPFATLDEVIEAGSRAQGAPSSAVEGRPLP